MEQVELITKIQGINRDLINYYNDKKALETLIALTKYIDAVKNKELEPSYIGKVLFEQFMNAFTNHSKDIDYKNIDIKIAVSQMMGRLAAIQATYKDLEEEIKDNEPNITPEILKEYSKIKKKMKALTADYLMEVFFKEILSSKENMFVTNAFIEAIYYCKYCVETWYLSFGKSSKDISLQTNFIKDLISVYESGKSPKYNEKSSKYNLVQVLDDLFENENSQKNKKLIQQNFRKNEKDFQKLLMYAHNRYDLIETLLIYELINPENLIEINEQGEKYSILSCDLENNMYVIDGDFETTYYRLYKMLNIPQEIRNNDDIEILKKIAVEDIPYFIKNQKFVLTDEKFDIIIRRIRKELLKPEIERSIDVWETAYTPDLVDALKEKSANCAKYIREIINDREEETINKRRELIERLISILKFASEQSTSVQVGEVLTRVRAKKDEN